MSQVQNQPQPSTYDQEYWIWAENNTSQNNEVVDENCGKWMIFRNFDQIDEPWNVVRKATEEGLLGHGAKVATRKPAGPSRDGKMGVICIYTKDWTDEADVMRVREQLRSLGFTEKLAYKSDSDTIAGKYRHTGHKRISKYYC